MQDPTPKLTIDLGALAANYQDLKTRVGYACRVAVVLKANAYGLGARRVSQALYDQGCRDFFVAKPAEALALTHLPADRRIYVLNGFYDSCEELYVRHDLTPVLGSFVEIDLYTKLAAKMGHNLPAFLKFNTRMNRLGLGVAEQEKLFADMSRLNGLTIEGIMSHLACADIPDHPMNALQYDLFKNITQRFPGIPCSLANSSGIFLGPQYHFDMVRPGAALYGLNPTLQKENPMRRVVSLDIPVIRCRLVYKDAHIGYGATFRFEKDSWVATLSAGYADGIFLSLSNKGKFYWKNYACPIHGRVSMDLTSVDLSDVPENERPGPGDFLELIGPHQDADALAVDAGTIGYEVLTALGQRYDRIYING